mgnify:CR=1 FL=1
MSEKVERCRFFLMTGRARVVPYYKECNACPLRNAEGNCINDIMDKHSLQMSEEISAIWRDYFEKRGQRLAR